MNVGKTPPGEPGPAPRPGGVTAELLREYDRPGPRYTSYPTAVEFASSFDEAAYRRQLEAAAEAREEPLSLYLHLPFCEERCSFCGCMVIITRRREVADHYLAYLKREIDMLAAGLKGRRRVVQYHWGGGTPTYLSVAQMTALHEAVTRRFDVQAGAEVAIEVDPRVTSREQIERLRELGFNRLSLGVQDFTPEVQQAIASAEKELDGNGRVVVRYSGTEMLARVMVEAESKEKMQALTAGIAGEIQRALGV